MYDRCRVDAESASTMNKENNLTNGNTTRSRFAKADGTTESISESDGTTESILSADGTNDGGNRGNDVPGIEGVERGTEGTGEDDKGTTRETAVRPRSFKLPTAKPSRINYSRKIGEGAGEKDAGEEGFPVQTPKVVSFSSPETPKRGRPLGSTSSATSTKASSLGTVKADDLAFLCSAGFGFAGMTRPIYLRPAWNFTPEECAVVSDKLIVVLKQMPQHVVSTIEKFVAPVGLIVAAVSMVKVAGDREKEIHEHYARMVAEKPETADTLRKAGFKSKAVNDSEFSQASDGGNPANKTVSTDFDTIPNATGFDPIL
jgi:hypothetical protein